MERSKIFVSCYPQPTHLRRMVASTLPLYVCGTCVMRVGWKEIDDDERERSVSDEQHCSPFSYVLGVLYVDVGRDRKAERGARSHRVICMEPEKKWHMSVPLEPG